MRYFIIGAVAVIIGISLIYSTLLLPEDRPPEQTNSTGPVIDFSTVELAGSHAEAVFPHRMHYTLRKESSEICCL